jgi:ribonuclease HI
MRKGAMSTPSKAGIIAYTDGSFQRGTDDQVACGYAAVIVSQGKELITVLNGTTSRDLAMHQPSGEIQAALVAVAWAEENGYQRVEIRYDYEGVGKWPDRAWKTNKEGTRRYAAEINAARGRGLEVVFSWVRGHNADPLNELADENAWNAAQVGLYGVVKTSRSQALAEREQRNTPKTSFFQQVHSRPAFRPGGGIDMR